MRSMRTLLVVLRGVHRWCVYIHTYIYSSIAQKALRGSMDSRAILKMDMGFYRGRIS